MCLEILDALNWNCLTTHVFPIVKILHLHLKTMPALVVNSYTSESKAFLRLGTTQPRRITATPW